MEKRVLPTWVDPRMAVIKEQVNQGQKVTFQYFRDDEFWYKTDKGLLFPVSLKEAQAGRATFLAQDKAIYYMRWIKRYIEACKKEANENSNNGTPDGKTSTV